MGWSACRFRRRGCLFRFAAAIAAVAAVAAGTGISADAVGAAGAVVAVAESNDAHIGVPCVFFCESKRVSCVARTAFGEKRTTIVESMRRIRTRYPREGYEIDTHDVL